jgi:glycogen synthase
MDLLKIAYLSFEYPPDTAIGGIATYTEQISKLMAARGHMVEVFTSSPSRELLHATIAPNLVVHRIHTTNRNQFHEIAVKYFSERHQQIQFHIVESPEYSFEGLGIQQAYPQLPMVVRFHTPSFWVKELNRKFSAHQTKETLKKLFGIKQYKKEKDGEYLFAQQSNYWTVPSAAMKEVLLEKWNANPATITVLPNPFLANENLLSINAETNFPIITYFGRLEIRKGLTQLTKAIPLVLQQYPSAKFRFIGKSDHGPNKRIPMADYMKQQLKDFAPQLEFINHVPKKEIETYLAQTDICVFPSLWEVFGYVCVEAMAAARGIVASKHGGMKDMLEDVNGGILVDPFEPQQIADGILYLLNNPGERIAMGLRSRKKAADYYSKQVITNTEDYYKSIL